MSLAPEWLEALNRDRERAGEIAAHKRDMRAYNLQSEAYRNRHRVKADATPERTTAELESVSEEADPGILAALREFLRRNPNRAGEPPRWFSVALWAEYYLESKPPPEAVEFALADLKRGAA